MYQQSLMKFDPTTGNPKPYPSYAKQYREYHGNGAWLFCPWTGDFRYYQDVGSDPTGLLIIPSDEPVYA